MRDEPEKKIVSIGSGRLSEPGSSSGTPALDAIILPPEPEPGTEGQPGKTAAQSAADTKQILKSGFSVAFGLLAPGWSVTESECQIMAESWAPVADLYLPDLPDHPLVLAIATTAMIFMPRIGKPRKPDEKQKPGTGSKHEPVTYEKPAEPASSRGQL